MRLGSGRGAAARWRSRQRPLARVIVALVWPT